jgi:hypothetical protein
MFHPLFLFANNRGQYSQSGWNRSVMEKNWTPSTANRLRQKHYGGQESATEGRRSPWN